MAIISASARRPGSCVEREGAELRRRKGGAAVLLKSTSPWAPNSVVDLSLPPPLPFPSSGRVVCPHASLPVPSQAVARGARVRTGEQAGVGVVEAAGCAVD